MAARLRRAHQDSIRAKIQTSQLINRLEGHALGEVELSATQIKAIEVLIRKTLPDLSATLIENENPAEVADYDMSRLDDRELDTVEAALAKAAVASSGEVGTVSPAPDSLH